MKGKIIIFSILAGLVIGLGWVIFIDNYLYEANKYSKTIIFGLSIFVQSLTIYWAIRLTREESGGEIKFLRGFFTGIIVSVVIGTTSGAGQMINLATVDAEKVDHIKNFSYEMIEQSYENKLKEHKEFFDRNEELSVEKREEEKKKLDEQYDLSKKMVDDNFSPSGALAVAMRDALFTGIFISVVGAAIMMRRRRQ